jgi:hypothetical protein
VGVVWFCEVCVGALVVFREGVYRGSLHWLYLDASLCWWYLGIVSTEADTHFQLECLSSSSGLGRVTEYALAAGH